MSSSLALSGNDTFVARVIPENRPQGMISRTNKRISGVGGAPKLRHRIVSILAIMLLFVGITASIFTQTQKSAQANWFTDGIRDIFCGTPAYFNEPVGWQNGLSSLGIAPPPPDGVTLESRKGNPTFLNTRKTAYDKFGMSGATWTIYSGEKDNKIGGDDRQTFKDAPEDLRRQAYESECIPVVGIITTYMANSIFSLTKFLTSVSGWIITQAYDPAWLKDLNQTAAQVITGENAQGVKIGTGLKDSLYLEFLNLVILMGALWLFYTGIIKRKTTEATTGAMWMVGAVIAGSLMVYNPSFLPDLTTDVTSSVASGILVGTSEVTVTDKPGKESNPNLCYRGNVDNIGSTAEERAQITKGGSTVAKARADARRDFVIAGANCQMWRAFVYEPWVVGQFGVGSDSLRSGMGPFENAPAVDLGGGTTVRSWSLYQMSQQVISPDEVGKTGIQQENRENWYKVVDAIASPEGEQALYGAWSGGDSGSARLGIATASVVASGFAIIITSVLAMGMLVYSVAAAILMFVSVFFFLLGAHPGMGRRMAMRWFEMYVGAILKKIILSIMLAMMLAFYTSILTNTSSGWGTSVIAIVAVSVAILMYRKELLDTVTNSINFGGAGISDNPTSRAGETFRGVAAGATVGLGMGALAGGKVAGGIMKSGVGTAGARRAAAARATVAGATKGALRTGMRGGMAGNSRTGAALAMSNAMGQNVGGQAARGVEDKFNERYAPPVDPSTQGETPITRSSGDRFTSNHSKYMRDWNANKNNPAWQAHIKRSYGLGHVPNPYEEAFDGYKKDRSQWTTDDVPRPLHDSSVPTSAADESPATSESEGGNNSGESNDDKTKNDNNGGTSTNSAPVPQRTNVLPGRPGSPSANGQNSQAKTVTPQVQSQRTSTPTPRPAEARERVYSSEAERRLHEAEDRDLEERRKQHLRGVNAMPERSSKNTSNVTSSRPTPPPAPNTPPNSDTGKSSPTSRSTPPPAPNTPPSSDTGKPGKGKSSPPPRPTPPKG